MSPEELIELLEERPFMALRLHLADGRVREIRHPEMALVSETHVAIGVPRGDESKVAQRFTFCSIPNIIEVEPFDIHERGRNGEKGRKKGRGR
ncbi:MAG: hypothetical protein L0211_00830 [Planctomycetaceae bacterium]|nr:hypothetical protein [Planctomycetaceae bacterium]